MIIIIMLRQSTSLLLLSLSVSLYDFVYLVPFFKTVKSEPLTVAKAGEVKNNVS